MRFFAALGALVSVVFTLLWVGAIAGGLPPWAFVIAALFLVLLWLRFRRPQADSFFHPGDAMFSPFRNQKRD